MDSGSHPEAKPVGSADPEKASITEAEVGREHHHGRLPRKDEIDRIDAIATAEGVTLASFAHLDEAKIRRKVRRFYDVGLVNPRTDVRVDGPSLASYAGDTVSALLPGPWQQ